MSDTALTVKASLWREGFALFAEHWKEWLKWAVVFFVVMAALQIIFYDPTLMSSIEQLNDKAIAARKAGQKLAAEDTAAQVHLAIHALLLSLPFLAVGMLQAYFYVVFFMRRQSPLIGEPKLSVGRFFYWLWNIILLSLLGIPLGGLLIGVPAGVGVALGKMQLLFTFAGLLLAFCGVIASIYVFTRLSLVPTLAICGMKTTFRTSWEVTKGNCWRVIGNGLLFMLMLLMLGLLVSIAERAILEILYALMPDLFANLPTPDASAAHPVFLRLVSPAAKGYGTTGAYIDMVFGAANLCVLSGFLRAFIAAMTHILYQERKMAGAL